MFSLAFYLVEALLEDFDDAWGVGNIPCRREKMKISWNWKDMVAGIESISWPVACFSVIRGLSLVGEVGVVLGRVGWWAVLGRVFCYFVLFYFLHGSVTRLRDSASLKSGLTFLWFIMHLTLAF